MACCIGGACAGLAGAVEVVAVHTNANASLIAFYGYTHTAEESGHSLNDYPGIRHWLARIAAMPGHITMDA